MQKVVYVVQQCAPHCHGQACLNAENADTIEDNDDADMTYHDLLDFEYTELDSSGLGLLGKPLKKKMRQQLYLKGGMEISLKYEVHSSCKNIKN